MKLLALSPDPTPGAVKRARPHPHLDLLEGVEVPGVLPLGRPRHGHRGQLGLRDGLADGGDVAASLGPDVAVPHATRGERGREGGFNAQLVSFAVADLQISAEKKWLSKKQRITKCFPVT